MGTESHSKAAPKVVKLGKALELAEAWVNDMSGSAMAVRNEVDVEGRPPRLGLGAKVTPNAKVAASSDPVERKLLGKLIAAKRQSSETYSKTSLLEDGGEDADEPESRTGAFVKKRASPVVTLPSSKKKK